MKLFATLTDATNPANRSATLSLASGSTAAGVGLQILRGGSTLVNFGPDSPEAGDANQWYFGTSINGPMTIPLGVRYIQTDTSTHRGT